MANLRISALPAASTPLAGTETLPIVQGGITEQVSVANLTAGRAVSATSLTANVVYTTALAASPATTTQNFYIYSSGGLNANAGIEWQYSASGSGYGFKQNVNSGTDTWDVGYRANSATWTRAFAVGINGNATIDNGNLVIGTSGKGVTTGSAIPLGLGTNGTVTHATVHNSGNVSIGSTTDAGSRVFINGDGTNPAFRSHAATSNTSVYAGIFRHESTTSGAYIQFITDGGVETGRIYDSGGTMQYASSSDARLKTNVQPMGNALQSVLALNPCTYDMRRGEHTVIASAGLIAQEVYDIYPYAVGVGGENENTNPWSVDYGKLTPLLIAAIKELQAEVSALKTQLMKD